MTTARSEASAIDPTASYTVKELAGLLKYGQTYIRDLIRAGKIKGFKPMGGHIRISGEEVRRLVQGVTAGAGISSSVADDGVDEIEVSESVAAKVMGGRAPAQPPEANDDGDGGAFRHLFGGE